MEAEELDAAAQRGQRPVGDARAAVRAEAAVEYPQVGREVLDRRIRLVAEPAPHEAELAPVRLVDVLVADRGRVLGQLALVARNRVAQLLGHRRQPRRDADLQREPADLVAVARLEQGPRALER